VVEYRQHSVKDHRLLDSDRKFNVVLSEFGFERVYYLRRSAFVEHNSTTIQLYQCYLTGTGVFLIHWDCWYYHMSNSDPVRY
jgi:hypothetical protein